jgi:hypothetical protein
MRTPIIADRLGNRQNVRFGERTIERGAAVTAGAEANHLGGVVHARTPLEIVAFETGRINQQLLWSRFSG